MVLTEHHLVFLTLKEAAQARPSLHLSKCHIVMDESFQDFEADFGLSIESQPQNAELRR